MLLLMPNQEPQKVHLIGHLGTAPEMQYTSAGQPFTTFLLAGGRVTSGAVGQPSEETEWFRVVAWDTLAERCSQHLRKDSKVYLKARLHGQWRADVAGMGHKLIEVIAVELLMLDVNHTANPEEPTEIVNRSVGRPPGTYKYTERQEFEHDLRLVLRMATYLKHRVASKRAIAYALDIDDTTLSTTLLRFKLMDSDLKRMAGL
jgi:single-strand DNA-binding protein